MNKEMTFEELLESKLQESNIEQQLRVDVPKAKKEFLRKSSNSRQQVATGERHAKSQNKKKYNYYADNFMQSGSPTQTSKP